MAKKPLNKRIKEGNEEVMYVKHPRTGKVVRTVFGAYERDFKSTPTTIPTATPTLFVEQLQKVKQNKQTPLQNEDFLSKEILSRTRKYNIPDALAASQWAVESGRSTSSDINNYFGLGPHIKYNSIDDNVRDYALTLKNILAAKGKKIENMKYPKKILLKLQEGDKPRYEAHNPDPMTYVNTVMNTPEWRQYAPAYVKQLSKIKKSL